jgi:hypothetical protein
MSGLLEFAKNELEYLGYDLNQEEEDPDKWIVENVLELIETFAKQGHSGSSAPYCVGMFKKLASYEPIAPLSGDDSEWTHIGNNRFQNKRCGHVFKDEDGTYDINGKIFREPDGSCFTSGDSRVPVEFPYTPKTEYVDVPGDDDNA